LLRIICAIISCYGTCPVFLLVMAQMILNNLRTGIVRRVTDINSAAAMAERRCGRLKCGESNVALTFGGVGHFQRNPGKAFSTRQAGRAPAPVGEEGRR
jgi:hypothetical protein